MFRRPGTIGNVIDLETLAFVNYGHFTVLPVFPAGVRGLGLHLARLDRDARIVFGQGVNGQDVRTGVAAALQGHDLPARVRVTAYVPNIQLDRLDLRPELAMAVRPVSASRPVNARLRSSVHRRYLPEVKHVGTFGLLHEYREALRAGYDDAVFVDGDGRISETTVSNIAFHDGTKVVLPAGPALPGVEMELVKLGLERLGVGYETRDVRLADLPDYRYAFTTNVVNGVAPIASVDDVKFDPDPEITATLQAAHESNPYEPLVTSDTGAGAGNDLR
ncbi:aminotransferase class IV family protein [Kibdelosporangium lantanae]